MLTVHIPVCPECQLACVCHQISLIFYYLRTRDYQGNTRKYFMRLTGVSRDGFGVALHYHLRVKPLRTR
jgi:hypothetical protein